MKPHKTLLYLLVLSPLLFTVLLQYSYSELTADSQCRDGYVLVLRINVQRYACVFDDTASAWESLGIAEVTEEMAEPPVEQVPEETPTEGQTLTDTSTEGQTLTDTSTKGQTFVEDISMPEEPMVFPDAIKYTTEEPAIDPQKGYFVDQIADGIYWLIGGGYQTMFVTTGEGVIAVDAPQSIGLNYTKAISEVTQEPVTYMVYSHSHADHVGMAGTLFPNATFVSHKLTADVLLAANDTNRPVPTLTFDNDQYDLTVGNQTLELYYLGNFHSDGDILIYAPVQKVAMLVDLLRPGEPPYRAFGVTPDIDLYLKTHDTLLNDFDFDVLISGHTNLLATKEDVATNKQFTLDVMENAKVALQNATANPQEDCAQMTTEQWQGRLSNLDTYMIDHCTAMIEYLSSGGSMESTDYMDTDPFSVNIPLDKEVTSDRVSIQVPDDVSKERVKNQLDLLAFKIEQMTDIAENQDIIDAIITSNNRFAAMKDVNAYIAEKDQEWIKTPRQSSTPFMSAILESSISDILREKTIIPTQDFGEVLFPEIIITNAYGANVGQSHRTEDYNQADETWWIRAKTESIQLKEVSWDPSAEIFSSDIIIKIVDKQGNFIGVLKAVTPIRDV